jgi:purine-nucleoside phosphorylase
MRLLLGAFPPELGSLFAVPPEGWKCACTGVGAISAAAATARLIAEERPEQVVFLGSCGAYHAGMELGSFLSARHVLASSLAEVRGDAYRPELELVRWTASVGLPFPERDVVVPPAITRSLVGARDLASLGPVEHLELSGVFEACRQAGVPCGAALVVVNAVGPEAHAQWQAHHAEASRCLIAALMEAGFFVGG